MEQISLNSYKELLINFYSHECDNNYNAANKRREILSKKYRDSYLENIIAGTYSFIDKILEISAKDYYGFIKIPLSDTPEIEFISLNLTGGWMSDTIVRDSDNNFYSMRLLYKVFGPQFFIEPDRIEIMEEWDEDDDFCILSEIPSYYLYIQCEKEIIENVRNSIALDAVSRILKK